MPFPDSWPTLYPALNAVLEHFLTGVREVLPGNIIGAYLQGSFALGDYDQHNDVDFLVVTHHDPTDAEVAALGAQHAAIHDFPPPGGIASKAPMCRRRSCGFGRQVARCGSSTTVHAHSSDRRTTIPGLCDG